MWEFTWTNAMKNLGRTLSFLPKFFIAPVWTPILDKIWTSNTLNFNIIIRPSLDGTYYGMALSVRPSVRPFVRPSDC